MLLNDSWRANFYLFLTFTYVFIHYQNFYDYFSSQIPFYTKYFVVSYSLGVASIISNMTYNVNRTFMLKLTLKLEQLERLCSEDTPRRPMITHTTDQFVLNPKSILLTSSYRIPSQNKVKAEKLAKFAEN